MGGSDKLIRKGGGTGRADIKSWSSLKKNESSSLYTL